MKTFLIFLKNTGAKIRLTHPVGQIVAFALFAALFFMIFMRSLTDPYPYRAVFYYPEKLTGATKTEIRHLPRPDSRDERFNLYLQELLLGPVNADLVPIFNGITRVKSAFIRGDEAYIDLSAGALERDRGVALWPIARDLFKKNVFTNFRNIAKLYIYIDGQEVYGESLVNVKPKK